MRTATVERKTRETEIVVSLDLDGTGDSDIDTGIGFLDHMLESFSRHSMIDLKVRAQGDLHVDYHHTTEDTAIVIGQAVPGDKKAIPEYDDESEGYYNRTGPRQQPRRKTLLLGTAGIAQAEEQPCRRKPRSVSSTRNGIAR